MYELSSKLHLVAPILYNSDQFTFYKTTFLLIYFFPQN